MPPTKKAKAPTKKAQAGALVSPEQTASASSRTSNVAFAPAYLLSLEMENVRSFGPRQRLSLMTSDGRPARWTVILGNNGLGKTTVLEALALLLPEKRDMGSKFVGLSRIAQHFYTVGSGKVRP